jgi:hypothetical protein
MSLAPAVETFKALQRPDLIVNTTAFNPSTL